MGAQPDEASGRFDRRDVTVAQQAIEKQRAAPRERYPWGGYATPRTFTSPFEEAARTRYYTMKEDRAWEYGHGGYSGTFAEKGEVSVHILRANLTPKQWRTLIGYVSDYDQGPIAGPIATVAKKLALTAGDLKVMNTTYEDKWGPALMLVTPDRRYWVGGYCSS